MSTIGDMLFNLTKKAKPVTASSAFQDAWKSLGPQQAAQGGDYWKRISSFDPTASVNEYARGAAGQASTYLTDALTRLGGSAVGAGRLDTGFYDTDQGDLVKSVQQDLNEKIAMQATNAAGMQLQQYGQMGQYATGTRQDYYDLLSGQLDRETSERNAKRAETAAKWQAAGNAIGGIAKKIPVIGSFL